MLSRRASSRDICDTVWSIGSHLRLGTPFEGLGRPPFMIQTCRMARTRELIRSTRLARTLHKMLSICLAHTLVMVPTVSLVGAWLLLGLFLVWGCVEDVCR